VAIEIEAAQGWPLAQHPGWHAAAGPELPIRDFGQLEDDILFGPGVQLPAMPGGSVPVVLAAPDVQPSPVATPTELRGDHGVRGARADQDALDMLASKFGALEVDGATTFLAKVLSLLPPSIMGAIPAAVAPQPRAGRRRRPKGELLPSRRSSRISKTKNVGAPAALPCILEEVAPLELGVDSGAGNAASACLPPLDAEEIARIQRDTGVLLGTRVALPDAELQSILDMEA
jgi:hypothetical protein